MSHTVIQLPVPPSRLWCATTLASRVPPVIPAETGDACAHVTLLGPFMDERDVGDWLISELTDFFANVAPIDFQLVDVRRFPDGTVYLAPEPEAPFRQLSEQLASKYPAWPPYGGAFDEIVPHVSLGSETRI